MAQSGAEYLTLNPLQGEEFRQFWLRKPSSGLALPILQDNYFGIFLGGRFSLENTCGAWSSGKVLPAQVPPALGRVWGKSEQQRFGKRSCSMEIFQECWAFQSSSPALELLSPWGHSSGLGFLQGHSLLGASPGKNFPLKDILWDDDGDIWDTSVSLMA